MNDFYITFVCPTCGQDATANPDKVPCLTKEGYKRPICQTCADKWNEIHRTSKGLEPLDYGDAYDVSIEAGTKVYLCETF